MLKRRWVVLNVLIFVIVMFILAGMLWGFSSRDVVIEREECVAVNIIESFSYDSCYDAFSETIFLNIKRGIDDYEINFLEISFFGFEAQSYDLTDVPVIGGSKAYKIFAGKYPQNLDVVFDIVKNFSAPICEEAKKVFVRYCPMQTDGEIGVSISPLTGVGVDDYVQVTSSFSSNSDVFDLSLVDKERIWETMCKSSWKCEEWDGCVDGVQKRNCEDVNKCFVSTSVPAGVRYCDGGCIEDWECEWSDCSGGYTVPKCKDLNGCGTSYDIPQKLKCDFASECIPDVECGEWTDCEVDYNFFYLIGSGISNIDGFKSRICEDKNFCLGSMQDTISCFVNVDIYTKKFVRCGVEFIGVYNRLNNELVARIREGKGGESYMDIYFDDRGEDAYCDYCYDGVLNSDEEGIDCGGSCISCDEKYKIRVFKKKSWVGNFVDWMRGLF